MTTTIYADYTEGQITPQQALRALVSEYGEVESELKPLEQQRDHLREQLSLILTRIDGETATIKGFGTVRLTQASVVDKWDAAALETLIAELDDAGMATVADDIRKCKGKTMRSGGLRVERERTK